MGTSQAWAVAARSGARAEPVSGVAGAAEGRASRIPQPLWALAVRLAKAHGVSRTAAVLGLDYYRLKKRAEAAASQPQSSGPAFVELTSPVTGRQAVSVRAGQRLRGHHARATGRLRRGRRRGPVAQLLERPVMLQITPQMKILVAVEPADFRRGIDGLARLCQEALQHDPFAGAVFVFRNRKATAAEAAHVRRPGILALPQAALPGPLPLVALGRGRRGTAPGRASAGGLALGRRPDANRRGGRLAAGRAAGLTRP